MKKNRIGLKVTALALCCALLGGAVGGGIVWGVGRSGDETSVNVSGRTVSQVALKTVDGKTAMSDAEVYAANVNSVVSINVTGTNSNNFFGQPVQTASSGSGFILTTDGYIVTNYHVVEDAQTVKVTLYNGDEYDAQYVGGDEDYDIAVIKIEASGLQAVTLGDSEKLNVGDRVLAIGNPLGPDVLHERRHGLQREPHHQRGRHALQYDPDRYLHQPRQLRWSAAEQLRRGGGYRVRQILQLRQLRRECGGLGLRYPHQ